MFELGAVLEIPVKGRRWLVGQLPKTGLCGSMDSRSLCLLSELARSAHY